MRKRPLTITAKVNGKRADVRIEGEIDGYAANNAKAFEAQINSLVSQGITDAHVFIDSEGGSVFEATRIVNAIKRFTGTLSGEGGAMVASAATRISIELKPFLMAANGMFMVHKPSTIVAGNEDTVVAELALLKKLSAEYKAAYAAKTGKSEEEIEALWMQDRWMTAQEAFAEGFTDGVLGEADITPDARMRIAACGCPTSKLPAATEQATNKEDMDIKALRTTLVMPDTATEAEVLAKINQLNTDMARHVEAAAQLRTAEITGLIDKAVTDKRITEAHRAGFMSKFSADFAATKAELEAIAPVVSLKADAPTGATGAGAVAKGREAWTYDEWATKDMKGLQAMMKSDADGFKTLYTAKYGVEPKLPA